MIDKGRGRRLTRRLRIAWVVVPSVTIAGLFAVAGCSGREQRTEGRERSAPEASTTPESGPSDPPPVHPGAAHDTVEAEPVTWDVTSVRQVLEAAGISPGAGADSIRQPFMRAPGIVLALPGGTLQLYIYGDAVARGQDTDLLDTVRVAPPATMVTWVQPATLITDNNLAAILLTGDAALRRSVRQALTAHARRTHGAGGR